MENLVFLLMIVAAGSFVYLKKMKGDGPRETMSPSDKVTTAKTAQDFTIFEDIKDEMIIVDKRRFRAVLKLQPINLPMYSFSEQVSIKERFRSAMLGVRYPFSFYLPSLRNNPRRTVDQIVEVGTKFIEKGHNNLATYGEELANWISWQTSYRSPLEPGYYVVINYEDLKNAKGYTDEVIYQQAITELNTRVYHFIGGLGRAEIKATRLKTNELIQLMFFAFNRDLSNIVRVEEAVKKGIFGLYTTSQDQFVEDDDSVQEACEEAPVTEGIA